MRSERPAVMRLEMFVAREKPRGGVEYNKNLIVALKLANITAVFLPQIKDQQNELLNDLVRHSVVGIPMLAGRKLNKQKNSSPELIFKMEDEISVLNPGEVALPSEVCTTQDYLSRIYSGLITRGLQEDEDKIIEQFKTLRSRQEKSEHEKIIEEALTDVLPGILIKRFKAEGERYKARENKQTVAPFIYYYQHAVPGSKGEKIYSNANTAMQTFQEKINQAFVKAEETSNVDEMMTLVETLSTVKEFFDKFKLSGEFKEKTIKSTDIDKLENMAKRLDGYSTVGMKAVSGIMLAVISAAIIICPVITVLSDEPKKMLQHHHARFYHQKAAKPVMEAVKGLKQMHASQQAHKRGGKHK